MNRWSLLLAETQEEPSEAFLAELPGVRRAWDRVWLWEDWPSPEREKRAVPFGESPLYGKTYARFVAKGEGVEVFRHHPLGRRIGEARAREVYRALAGGSPKAQSLEEALAALGFGDLLEEVRAKARDVRSMVALLAFAGVPYALGDTPGEVLVGNPPLLAITTSEEAMLVARTYRWAREAGVGIRPRLRGKAMFLATHYLHMLSCT